MRSKMRVVIITAFMVASSFAGATESSLGSVKVHASSQEELAEFLGSVHAEYGEDAARMVYESIAYVVGGSMNDSKLEEAYAEQDFAAMVDRVDALKNWALSEVEGITIDELRKKAAPIEHDFRVNRKKAAIARLPAFEEEKARVELISDLNEQVLLLNPSISRDKDEYGFLAPSFNVTVRNESELTLRAIDLEVHAWSSVDNSVKGETKVQLLFGNQSLEPGDSFDISQELSPLAELTAAVVRGAGQGIRIKLLSVYTAEKGRTGMKGEWTDKMEANRLQLKEYSEYSSGD